MYAAQEWTDYKTVEIYGREGNVQIKVRVHKWERVWDGRCECGGIVGSSRHCNSQNSAAENAIKDYVIKAGEAGLLTPEQVLQWK
jgi:hypothetical protein